MPCRATGATFLPAAAMRMSPNRSTLQSFWSWLRGTWSPRRDDHREWPIAVPAGTVGKDHLIGAVANVACARRHGPFLTTGRAAIAGRANAGISQTVGRTRVEPCANPV